MILPETCDFISGFLAASALAARKPHILGFALEGRTSVCAFIISY